MPNPERSDLPPSVAEINNPPVVSHLPRRSERAQKVIDFVRQSISNGQPFPPFHELAVTFGYSSKSDNIRLLLKSEGLSRKKEGRHPKPCQIPPPSNDLAWIIGVITGRGYSNPEKSGQIVIPTQNNTTFQAEIKSVLEGLFAINVEVGTHSIKNRRGLFVQSRVQLQNSQASRFLGDLRRDNWSRTVSDKHSWILRNQEYMWSLINGFFDAKGSIYIRAGKGTHHIIYLRTTSVIAANFLAELLSQLGITGIGIHRNNSTKSKISEVKVVDLENIILFANHVHSTIEDKEVKLQYYRNMHPNFREKKVYSDEEGVEEWTQLIQQLGRSPKSHEIQGLKRTGRTRFSVDFYLDRFGQGSFIRARENLERIIAQRE